MQRIIPKFISIICVLIIAIYFFNYFAQPVFAQDNSEESNSEESNSEQQTGFGDRIKIPNPLNPNEEDDIKVQKDLTAADIDSVNIAEIAARVARAAIIPIGGLAFLMFVIGGFFWIFSGGNEEKVKRGRDIMMWSIVGILVVFSSYALLTFFLRMIGSI
ncbi:MAG: hypothetical protein WC310_02510 [Patescibacteria group bacterium]|jgi:hypothetical protein